MASARRQLRDLEEIREDALRDLGSMALEMHIREEFQLDLLKAEAKKLAEADARIRELDPSRAETQS